MAGCYPLRWVSHVHQWPSKTGPVVGVSQAPNSRQEKGDPNSKVRSLNSGPIFELTYKVNSGSGSLAPVPSLLSEEIYGM